MARFLAIFMLLCAYEWTTWPGGRTVCTPANNILCPNTVLTIQFNIKLFMEKYYVSVSSCVLNLSSFKLFSKNLTLCSHNNYLYPILKLLIGTGMVWGYYILFYKNLVMVLDYFVPFHIPSNIEPLDDRGAAASNLKSDN